jgi:hypothetical protein
MSAPPQQQSLASNIYATPKTFMDMLTECAQYLDQARQDPGCSKDDVLDSLENRLSLLVGKLASHPACSEFRIELRPAPA